VPVALVSDGLAKRYWPHDNPIGRHITVDTMASPFIVVGVVADVLYDWTNRLPEPTVYLSIAQAPSGDAQFALRTGVDPTSFVTAARAELAAVDPGLPAFDVMRLSDAIRQSLSGSSQIVVMMGILAAVALLIAVVGLYGVVAYLVAART